ncbi:MAG: DAK2 domain-containing protein [Chloroflexi bacterium]|nr:DAK2 domain-containing protein [Chloroflexota bacterium]
MSELTRVIEAVAHDVLAAQAELNRLDGVAGDGDLGATMAAGATALLAIMPDMQDLDLAATLRRCGSELARKAPSTSGTLLATACLRAAGAAPGSDGESTTSIAARLVDAAMTGVQQRGKAQVGDKTMLDALSPAVTSLQDSAYAGVGLGQALASAATAARAGAEATRDLRARVGRAGWLADRAEGSVDAGADLVALLFESAARHVATDSRPVD